MLRCADCGAVLGESLLAVRRAGLEYWGECHGRPVYAPATCCPVCGGPPEQAAPEQATPEQEQEE